MKTDNWPTRAFFTFYRVGCLPLFCILFWSVSKILFHLFIIFFYSICSFFLMLCVLECLVNNFFSKNVLGILQDSLQSYLVLCWSYIYISCCCFCIILRLVSDIPCLPCASDEWRGLTGHGSAVWQDVRRACEDVTHKYRQQTAIVHLLTSSAMINHRGASTCG